MGFAHHHHEEASPKSPVTSNRSSPISGYYYWQAFPVLSPDAFVPEQFQLAPFINQHFPLGMLTPQQVSFNAWLSLQTHTGKTSPTISTKSSPGKAASSGLPKTGLRSGSSSPASPGFLSSPDAHKTTPTNTPAARKKKNTPAARKKKNTQSASPKHRPVANAKHDKETIYMQKRIKNNLAAKRSRALREIRENEFALELDQKVDFGDRIRFIKCEYIELASL